MITIHATQDVTAMFLDWMLDQGHADFRRWHREQELLDDHEHLSVREDDESLDISISDDTAGSNG